MKEKILFILNGIPSSSNVGSIMYKQIIEAFGDEAPNIISIEHVNNLKTTSHINKNSKMLQISFRMPENIPAFNYIRKLPLVETIYLFALVLISKNKVKRFVEGAKYDYVFAVLRHDTVFILHDVLKAKTVPLICYISDTVEAENNDHYLLYKLKKNLHHKYIMRSHSLATAGESMHALLKGEYKKPSEIVRIGYTKQYWVERSIDADVIQVLFCGSLYAKDEFSRFLEALDMFALEKKKSFRLIYASNSATQLIEDLSRMYNILSVGWVNETLLDEYAEICHFGYVPYKFDSKHEHQMRYGFPSKAGLYVKNGLPILFHGPKYSSFNIFNQHYEVGESVSSLNPIIIKEALNDLLDSGEKYRQFQKNCEQAYYAEYAPDILKKRVKNLL